MSIIRICDKKIILIVIAKFTNRSMFHGVSRVIRIGIEYNNNNNNNNNRIE